MALATAASAADPWRARLVAVAAVRCDQGQLTAVFETPVHPRCRLPRRVFEAIGLAPGELDEAPAFSEICEPLLEFIEDELLVGMDIRAQIELLGHELSRLDRRGIANRLLDLGTLAQRLGVSAGKPSLPGLAAAVNLSHPRPYRPSADARVAARVALELLTSPSTSQHAILDDLLNVPAGNGPGLLGRPDPPRADEPGIVLRWLYQIGPEHHVETLDRWEAQGRH